MIKLVFYLVFIVHIFGWVRLVYADEEKKCSTQEALKPQCAEFELCVNSVCKCKLGYSQLKGNCMKSASIDSVPSPAPYDGKMTEPEGANSHLAAAVIIPIMLILVVIGSVILLRKYNIVGWVRTKINQRQAPYDEVMIGQDDDDPPLVGV